MKETTTTASKQASHTSISDLIAKELKMDYDFEPQSSQRTNDIQASEESIEIANEVISDSAA